MKFWLFTSLELGLPLVLVVSLLLSTSQWTKIGMKDKCKTNPNERQILLDRQFLFNFIYNNRQVLQILKSNAQQAERRCDDHQEMGWVSFLKVSGIRYTLDILDQRALKHALFGFAFLVVICLAFLALLEGVLDPVLCLEILSKSKSGSMVAGGRVSLVWSPE